MRNSFIYATASTYINNLVPLYCIFNYIYIKNLFNFNFIPLNYLIKGILTFNVIDQPTAYISLRPTLISQQQFNNKL